MAVRLDHHFTTNSLKCDTQSANRARHLTETAQLRVLTDILEALDHGSACVLVLLDLSSAFDMLDHTILIERLNSIFCITQALHSTWEVQILCFWQVQGGNHKRGACRGFKLAIWSPIGICAWSSIHYQPHLLLHPQRSNKVTNIWHCYFSHWLLQWPTVWSPILLSKLQCVQNLSARIVTWIPQSWL